MFKKLKKKLILINMSLLTVVFVAIFTTIYFITASNINRDTEITLNNIMMDSKPNMGKPKPRNTLSIFLDSNNKIIDKFLDMNFDTAELQNLVDTALTTNKQSDRIKFSGSTFMFLIKPIPIGSKIVFVDITNQIDLLIKLLESFLLLGTLNLFILLLISIYLTNKSIKPIKDAFDKQKQFIADASHELKTPLSIIKTNSSLLLENPYDTIINQSKWIKYINDQTDRMSILINEMLSLAKLDIEANKVNFTAINLSKLIENILLSFEAILFENNITFDSKIVPNITILGNSEGINKIFSILMDNAIKHTNDKGKITVCLYQSNNKAKLIVKNTGDGIAEEYLEKIFERFFRVDNSRARETGGYGLGLSIAKSIVEQHHGKIHAESILNENTTFIVELPLKL